MHWPAWLVTLDEVSEADRDDLLRCFGRGRIEGTAQRWCFEHLFAAQEDVVMSELEGYDELMRSLLAHATVEQRLDGLTPEQVLARYSPEQVLARYSPEQRLADLSPDEQILAMSDELLRRLPESVLATFPPAVQARIRARLTH